METQQNVLAITGKLHQISETQKVSDTFEKREFVIVTLEKYPQFVKFELTQNNTNRINNYRVGDDIEVAFNVRGREHEGKVYNNLQAWRIRRVDANGVVVTNEENTVNNTANNKVTPENQSGDEDLPF